MDQQRTHTHSPQGGNTPPIPRTSRDLLWELLEHVMAWIFAYNDRARLLRSGALLFILATCWVLLAILPNEKNPPPIGLDRVFIQLGFVFCQAWTSVAGPPVPGGEGFCDVYANLGMFLFEPLLFEIPFQRLFRADVFQHILVLAFAGWLAFKIAAKYLNELFDLQDLRGAEHYLMQAAFLNPYHTLTISEGRVPLRESQLPIARIGGPGKVWVHLENAALFERSDGSAHVVGPTVRRAEFLGGFERLRKVIDLRDQSEVVNITGRSQDGIRVRANGVHIVYSVYRHHQVPTYQRPYPFQDPQAIENLVYKQGVDVRNVDMISQIRGALLDFFASHPLSEFLAMIQEPELLQRQQHEFELRKMSQSLSGSDEPVQPPPMQEIEGIDYVPRPEITELFYTRAQETALARGIQIDWIGVGAWDFPAQVIREKNQEAWRITRENVMRNHPAVFENVRQQQKIKEILRLVRAIPIEQFRRISATPGLTSEQAMRMLLFAYRMQMIEALSEYEHALRGLEKQIQQETDPVKLSALEEDKQRLTTQAEKIYAVVIFLNTRFYARYLSKPPAREVQSSQPTGKSLEGRSQ